MDPTYEPEEQELRQVYGLYLEQKRNTFKIDAGLFKNVVTKNKDVSCIILLFVRQSSHFIWKPHLVAWIRC
jgi:AICAR transformylase/IMP cyclohydrolase PurH